MKTIEIKEVLFWKIYNALRDAEGTLWRCDGATNPEDEELSWEITETAEGVEAVLNHLQKIVKTLKLEETE